MKKSRFKEEQIVAILKEQEGGLKVSEIARNMVLRRPLFIIGKTKMET